jgi:hypothetical protein
VMNHDPRLLGAFAASLRFLDESFILDIIRNVAVTGSKIYDHKYTSLTMGPPRIRHGAPMVPP